MEYRVKAHSQQNIYPVTEHENQDRLHEKSGQRQESMRKKLDFKTAVLSNTCSHYYTSLSNTHGNPHSSFIVATVQLSSPIKSYT